MKRLVAVLKKIKEGASENSYGIHVASLAGIPSSVLERAKDILSLLQKDETFNSLENKIETKKLLLMLHSLDFHEQSRLKIIPSLSHFCWNVPIREADIASCPDL